MVEIDISSIHQSDGYTDVSDFYVVVPLTMVAVTHATGTTATPPLSGYSLCSLKNNYQNLIHSMELVLNGKTIHDHQSFQNISSGNTACVCMGVYCEALPLPSVRLQLSVLR